MKKPRQLPDQPTRVESGPVQFGDDWPGVFIRGDNALWAAFNLRRAAKRVPDLAINLLSLAKLLESCKVEQ